MYAPLVPMSWHEHDHLICPNAHHPWSEAKKNHLRSKWIFWPGGRAFNFWHQANTHFWLLAANSIFHCASPRPSSNLLSDRRQVHVGEPLKEHIFFNYVVVVHISSSMIRSGRYIRLLLPHLYFPGILLHNMLPPDAQRVAFLVGFSSHKMTHPAFPSKSSSTSLLII